jgi:nitronate monooxygenase
MWSANALTERLHLKWPILQAPMGSASTPALAAAVSNAGGLGGLGMWGRSANQAARRIAGFRQQSGGSLNVNYPIWPEPRYAPEASAVMRQHLQVQHDTTVWIECPNRRAKSVTWAPITWHCCWKLSRRW